MASGAALTVALSHKKPKKKKYFFYQIIQSPDGNIGPPKHDFFITTKQDAHLHTIKAAVLYNTLYSTVNEYHKPKKQAQSKMDLETQHFRCNQKWDARWN